MAFAFGFIESNNYLYESILVNNTSIISTLSISSTLPAKNERMYSKEKENFKILECESTGTQGYMTAFIFFPLRSKDLYSLVNTFQSLAVFTTPGPTD